MLSSSVARVAGAFAIVLAVVSCGESDDPVGRVPSATPEPQKERGCPRLPSHVHEIVSVRDGTSVRVLDAPRGRTLGTAADETELGAPTTFPVAERRGCWLGVSSELAGNDELGWIRFEVTTLALSFTRYSLRADLSKRRLELRRGREVVKRAPVSVGAPATPTPTGRYGVTGVFAGGLNPFYGCCAIALSAVQPSLPPDWPGGDTIAIHGWNGVVGEAASNGCLRASDYDMRALLRHAALGMPIEIVP
jgi:hypothetical protein